MQRTETELCASRSHIVSWRGARSIRAAMKLVVKTVKGAAFDVEVDAGGKVSDIKQAIEGAGKVGDFLARVDAFFARLHAA